MIILRDGRHLFGRLTSFDQFSNVVLEETKEWMIYKDMLSEQELGCFIVRSDNIIIISHLEEGKLPALQKKLRQVSIEEMNQVRMADEDDDECHELDQATYGMWTASNLRWL